MSRVFSLTPQSAFNIVQSAAKRADLGLVAPHDLRRTCAKLSRAAGASIEQVQFLLGHASVKTTEAYLGGSMELRPGLAANDLFDPNSESEPPKTPLLTTGYS
jgi:integrase